MRTKNVSSVDSISLYVLFSQLVTKLKEILDREGIKQAELARESNLSNATIGRMYRGVASNIREATKGAVAKAVTKLSGTDYAVEQLFED